MRALFASGHAIDIVLAVIVLEAIVLIARGANATAVTLTLLPGMLILLAVRAALTEAAWPWVALALAASFPAHVADLRRRKL